MNAEEREKLLAVLVGNPRLVEVFRREAFELANDVVIREGNKTKPIPRNEWPVHVDCDRYVKRRLDELFPIEVAASLPNAPVPTDKHVERLRALISNGDSK